MVSLVAMSRPPVNPIGSYLKEDSHSRDGFRKRVSCPKRSSKTWEATTMVIQIRALSTAALVAAFTLGGSPSDGQQTGRGRWDIVEVAGQHAARFESGYIKVGERFYLVGGRQAPQPVEVFDPATRTW